MRIGAWERGQAMEVTCTEVSAEPGGRRRAPAVVGRHVGHTQHREGGSKDGEVDKPARWGTRPRRRPGNRQRKKFQGQETSSFRCYRRPGGNERWPHWGNLEVAGVTFRKPFPWRVCVCVSVAQSCPTLCNSMDCCLPGSSVHGILQARILEWVAIPFSRGSS